MITIIDAKMVMGALIGAAITMTIQYFILAYYERKGRK